MGRRWGCALREVFGHKHGVLGLMGSVPWAACFASVVNGGSLRDVVFNLMSAKFFAVDHCRAEAKNLGDRRERPPPARVSRETCMAPF